jgi:hypothetical protein
MTRKMQEEVEERVFCVQNTILMLRISPEAIEAKLKALLEGVNLP